MKNKMDQEYSFALRPASIEEAGLFYSNDEQDEALGTVGHLRLDFGHGFLPLRSTCYPHNDDQFDTLEFKILLREFLEAMQENGPLASLSSMEAYCQKHGGAITEDGQTYGYIWETERYRFCLRCTPSPFEYQGHLYCYDLWQQQIQKNCPVGQVTYASGEQQTFTVVQHYLQTIREELPYRDTTGFRFETLTDDPKVKTAVDDILLDFAGEENPRRACNYGLTEAGNQALRDAADPDSPHTYAWFVLTDCNTLEEQIFRDLILEEAIQIYQASDCQEKRIGVTKDEVATVDLVRSLDGEQQFFEDHRKLRSFQNDPFIASAVEKLKQELEQTVETQGFELSSPWTESDLQYQEYSQRMLSAISGLTSYAASLSAKGQDDTVGILRELLIDMCWIWEGYDPISETEMPWDEFLTQYMGPFDEAVEQARHTGNAPGIAPETKEQIFYGIGIHMRELTESCGNREQVRQWMSLAEQMNEEWAGTTQYPLFYQMINGPLWEGEMFKKPIIHLPYDMIPTSIVPKGWHYYHLYRDIKSIRIVDKCPEQGRCQWNRSGWMPSGIFCRSSRRAHLRRNWSELWRSCMRPMSPRTLAPTWTASVGRLLHGPGQSVQHGVRRPRARQHLRLLVRGRTENSREKGAPFVAASASVCPAVLRGRAGIPPADRRHCWADFRKFPRDWGRSILVRG